jgi:hypothetical protein
METRGAAPKLFEPVDGPMNDRIDDAYRAKYANSPYLNAAIDRDDRAEPQ